jgi:hypothetical protein
LLAFRLKTDDLFQNRPSGWPGWIRKRGRSLKDLLLPHIQAGGCGCSI